jgi:metal-responsive CopG/Arc/MetJ family transcriptional regulator
VDLLAGLDRIAAQQGESRATIIRSLLREGVERSTGGRRSAARQG